jgi:HD-GYP domain-containing protein (c-di-GMP phosphodiesterase class II)
MAFGISPRKMLREMGWVQAVDALLSPIGLLATFAAVEHPAAMLAVAPLGVLLAFFARERQARIDHALELSSAYRGTAFLLGDVIEADDEYTGSHSRDVVELSLAVGAELGLSPSERRDCEFTALLHDVGKIRVPTEIINKPGALTPEERLIINLHTIWGQEMLERVGGLLGRVGRLVRSCHERWDGDGYPDGLAGTEIPLVARIVCCCDAFNAMTTDRPYRKALSQADAVAELRACSSTQFDPAVVDALVRVVGEPVSLRAAA